MIPKIIHYCWLSNDPYPAAIQYCIDSWKKFLPDYEFVLWNFERFPKGKSKWVDEAFAAHKYAFAADYIRLYALYNYGGIYLDSDVEVVKPYDNLLALPYFMGKENTESGIEAATLGFEKGNTMIGNLLKRYEGRSFYKENGEIDNEPLPYIIRREIDEHFVYNPINNISEFNYDSQVVNIFPVDWFSPKTWNTKEMDFSRDTYSIHHYEGSWLESYNPVSYSCDNGNDRLISIIIPVYNTERFLDKCVDSVIRQTYRNIEIILVDDGSTDRSPEMCDRWAKIDSRVKVIHQKNGGLCVARNVGIDVATGAYIGFVDSDDYIDKTMYEKLFDVFCTEQNVGIASCLFYTDTDGEIGVMMEKWEFKETTIVTADDFARSKILQETPHPTWNKLYLASLFKDVKFRVGRINEDVLFMYDLAYIMKKKRLNEYIIPEHLLYYRIRQNGICRSTENFFQLSVIDNMQLLLKESASDGRGLHDFVYQQYLKELDALLILIKQNSKFKKFSIKGDVFADCLEKLQNDNAEYLRYIRELQHNMQVQQDNIIELQSQISDYKQHTGNLQKVVEEQQQKLEELNSKVSHRSVRAVLKIEKFLRIFKK